MQINVLEVNHAAKFIAAFHVIDTRGTANEVIIVNSALNHSVKIAHISKRVSTNLLPGLLEGVEDR